MRKMKIEEAVMVSERTKRMRKHISLFICVSFALTLLPLIGQSSVYADQGNRNAPESVYLRTSFLCPLIGINNPIALNEMAYSAFLSVQGDKKDEKTEKIKTKDDRLKDHGNSTSTKPVNGDD